MLLRLIFWLLHRHEWIDVKFADVSTTNMPAVVTRFFLQKCSHKYCQKYRNQKAVYVA